MNILKWIGYTLLSILGFIGLGCLFGFLYFVYVLFVDLVNKTVTYFQEWESKSIQNKAAKLRASIHHIAPDEHGYQGVVYNGETYLNLDSGEVIEHKIREMLEPVEQDIRILKLRSYETRKRLTALAGTKITGEQVQAMLEAPQIAIPRLPEKVQLFDVIDRDNVSLDNLTVGITLDENGNQIPVIQSIHDLMHLLSVGITGAGKTTWVLAFLAQIAMCEDIEVMCIDVHGSGFNVLQNWEMLRYPVARTNEQAKAILQKVKEESIRRMELYEDLPLADDLLSYNRLSDKPLNPWLAIIDEGTIMLADNTIAPYVASSVQGTRQYGIYVFMTGQTAKSNVIDTPIRDNFPTRIAFNNEKTSWRVVLGETPQGEFDEIPGRGWARLNGSRTPILIQAPYIHRRDFYEMVNGNGPRYEMPIVEGDIDFDEQVRIAWENLQDDQKGNKSALCRAVGLQPQGTQWHKVMAAADRLGLF